MSLMHIDSLGWIEILRVEWSLDLIRRIEADEFGDDVLLGTPTWSMQWLRGQWRRNGR